MEMGSCSWARLRVRSAKFWPAALVLVVGTVPGAQFGGGMSKKVNTKYLRMAIAVIIAVTGLRMWYQIVTGR